MDKVRKFKLWSSWEDERQNVWLQNMAVQGLHLRSVSWPGIYTFERGTPAQMAYRWDYHHNNFEPDYRRLLEDAGWEHVAASVGWHCWRKPIEAGRVPEIFSDPVDRLRIYRRMFISSIVTALIPVPSLCGKLLDSQPLAFRAGDWIMLAIGALATYTTVQLGRRMAALKSAA